MMAVRDAYFSAPTEGRYSVLDVGSRSQYSGDDTYRSLFSEDRFQYVGLDVVEGPNVDLVPRDPYAWEEIEDESLDFVISGQSFEHNAFFWITWAEIARTLRVNGLVAVVAPSSGNTHRCPFDCWRFYPDSWTALAAYTGLEVVEHYVESNERKVLEGMQWRDSLVVARKAAFVTASQREAFYDRLHKIVATRPIAPPPDDGGELVGTAITSYEARNTVTLPRFLVNRLYTMPTRTRKRLLEVIAPDRSQS